MIRYRNGCAALAVLALLAGPATAQVVGPSPGGDGASLAKTLSGVSTPLQITLRDIDDGTWRRFRGTGVEKNASSSGGGLFGALMGGAGEAMGAMLAPMMDSIATGVAVPGRDVFYTRGETIAIGGEVFLVAYQPQIKELDLSAMESMKDSEKMPVPKPMDASTPLTLSLLHLRTIGSLRDIRTVTMSGEIAESVEKSRSMARMSEEKSRAPVATPDEEMPPSPGSPPPDSPAPAEPAATAPQSRMPAIAEAIGRYADDHGGRLPALSNLAAVRTALSPYLIDDDIFAAEGESPAILPNPILSERALAETAKYADFTVAFYEATPGPGGYREVLFLNGRTARVGEAEWQKLKRISKIAP